MGGTMPASPGPVTTSCGGFAPSRDDSERAVLLVVESPKLTRPLPVTADVTLTLVQVPVATAPELPSWVPDGTRPLAGAGGRALAALQVAGPPRPGAAGLGPDGGGRRVGDRGFDPGVV